MRILNIFLITVLAIVLTGLAACQPSPAPEDIDAEAAGDAETATEAEAAEEPEVEERGELASITPDQEGTTVVVNEAGETIVVTNSPEGSGTVTAEGAGLTVSVVNELPEEWPEDVTVMDGFEVLTSTVVVDERWEANVTVSLGGNAPFEEIEAWYDEIEGWEKSEMSGALPSGTEEGILMVFNRDKEILTITGIKPDDESINFDVIINMQYVLQR